MEKKSRFSFLQHAVERYYYRGAIEGEWRVQGGRVCGQWLLAMRVYVDEMGIGERDSKYIAMRLKIAIPRGRDRSRLFLPPTRPRKSLLLSRLFESRKSLRTILSYP